MKTKSKALLLTLCAVLLVAASILGTMAYLTSTDEVKNTFTVGNVAITLDEAKVNPDGTLVKVKDDNGDYVPADRVKANSYKLMPGHSYIKDPTVTVKANSEDCYVKMTVTVNNASTLDKLFKAKGINLQSVVTGWSNDNWILKNNTEDKVNDTRTYEFWYKEKVTASATDTVLDALFDLINVPEAIDNTELASIQNTTITVNAYAIQADGFADAAAAWAAFDAE